MMSDTPPRWWESITKGATKSSKELTVSEAQVLIDGMERKLKAQPVAA